MRFFERCGVRLPILSLPCLLISAVPSLQAQEAPAGRVDVAVGVSHGVLLKSDGAVWTWGNSNDFGELGRDGDSYTPAPVPNMSGFRGVAADSNFSMALKSDGTVWTWGSNQQGQLGNGAKNEKPSPVPSVVRGLPRIVAISAGGKAAMALDANGAVWLWGRESDRAPEQVQKLPKVTAISAGDGHFVALDANGQVWVWGHHGIDEIQNGTSSDPQPVPGFSDMIAIAGGFECMFAVKKDGTVWAAGSRFWTSLSFGSPTFKPPVVTGLSGVKAIRAFGTSVYALLGDGTVWTWHRKPVRVGTLSGIAAIAAGLDSAAADTHGDVWTWQPFGSEAPKIAKITNLPIPPEKTAAQKECVFAPAEDQQRELFGCEAANRKGKWIQICGDPDPDDPEKYKNVNYRFGPENGSPDLVFPAHPETAPPSLFYSHDEHGNEVIRFSTGPYTYRLSFGLTTGYVNGQPAGHFLVEGGVEVFDNSGKRLARIVCSGAGQIGADFSRFLPPDSKKPDAPR